MQSSVHERTAQALASYRPVLSTGVVAMVEACERGEYPRRISKVLNRDWIMAELVRAIHRTDSDMAKLGYLKLAARVLRLVGPDTTINMQTQLNLNEMGVEIRESFPGDTLPAQP